MSDDMSLLPKDMRQKETEAKKKAKKSMPLPDFSMHMPDPSTGSGQEKDNKPVKHKDDFGVQFDREKPKQKKRPRFSLKRKNRLHSIRPEPTEFKEPIKEPVKEVKKVEPVKQEKRVELKPRKPEKKVESHRVEPNMKLRYPKEKKGFDSEGKRILKETSDRIKEAHESRPISEYFDKKDGLMKALKTPLAEVNFIAEDYPGIVRQELWLRIRVIVMIVLLMVVLFAIGFIGIKFFKLTTMEKYSDLSQQGSQITAQIEAFDTSAQRSSDLKDRALILEALLAKHVYWTKLFGLLEHNTVENVSYTNFVSGRDGQVILAASADSYRSIAQQVAIFENADFIDSVEMNSVNKTSVADEDTELQFNITLQLTEQAYYQ